MLSTVVVLFYTKVFLRRLIETPLVQAKGRNVFLRVQSEAVVASVLAQHWAVSRNCCGPLGPSAELSYHIHLWPGHNPACTHLSPVQSRRGIYDWLCTSETMTTAVWQSVETLLLLSDFVDSCDSTPSSCVAGYHWKLMVTSCCVAVCSCVNLWLRHHLILTQEGDILQSIDMYPGPKIFYNICTCQSVKNDLPSNCFNIQLSFWTMSVSINEQTYNKASCFNSLFAARIISNARSLNITEHCEELVYMMQSI